MNEYLYVIIDGIMDFLEDFFNEISLPTSKHINDSFIYSLIIFAVTTVLNLLGIWCFISWEESLTCCIILGLITLIDNTIRSNVKSNVNKIKTLITRDNNLKGLEQNNIEEEVDSE